MCGENKYSWYSLPPTTTENRNPANVGVNTRTFSPQKYGDQKSNHSCDKHPDKRIQIDKNTFPHTHLNNKAKDSHEDTSSVSKMGLTCLGSDPQDETEKPVNLVMHQNPGDTQNPDKNSDGDHELNNRSESVEYAHIYDEFNVKSHDMSVTQISPHN